MLIELTEKYPNKHGNSILVNPDNITFVQAVDRSTSIHFVMNSIVVVESMSMIQELIEKGK